MLCLLLLVFNGYYFFVRSGLGPNFYINKFLYEQKDNITHTDIYKDLNEEYLNLNKDIVDQKIVFVGDSITKRFNIHEFSQKIGIINRGIFSDTTHGLLNRLETNVNNLKISKLFVMIGYNDLKFRTNVEIIQNIKKILLKSKADKIFFQSLLPVKSDIKDINDRIIYINDQIKKMATSGGYIYVDLHSHFISNDNEIKSELTRDGIHPNYFGYKLWFSLIEHLLKKEDADN